MLPCNQRVEMKITRNKLIPLLVIVLVSISLLRLVRITIKTTASTSPKIPLRLRCPAATKCRNPQPTILSTASAEPLALTDKESRFLSDIIYQRAPCKLLFFGVHSQYLALSSTANVGGFTLFLEDDVDKLNTVRSNSNRTRIYKVHYQMPVSEAYSVLRQAREGRACQPGSSLLLKSSTCPLALTKLPKEVYEMEWDVVVVDGPSGEALNAQGRMAAIYTAGVIARTGNVTHVVVHDVDRMVEKWFSWEFLCEQNLVSSKGKLWGFKIMGGTNSTRFCPERLRWRT